MRLLLLLLSVCGVGFGLGWWVHPGFGIAVGAALLGVVVLTYGDKEPADGEAS